MRPAIDVDLAQPDELAALAALCVHARDDTVLGPKLCSSDVGLVAHHLGLLLSTPGGYALLARDETGLVGFLLARVIGPGPFADEPNLYIDALYVGDAARRRGVGHALLDGAVGIAENAGAENICVIPLPGSRGLQRFLAQLGFAPAGGHRVSTSIALRRRLTDDAAPAPIRRARGLEDLIARRRHVRAESGGIDMREFQAGVSDAAGLPPDEVRRSSIRAHVRRAVQTRLSDSSTTTTS